MKTHLLAVAALALAAGLIHPAHADDNAIKAKLDQAQKLYDKRDRSNTSIVDAIKTLESALADGPSDPLKYDILVLESRAQFWLGDHTDGDEGAIKAYETGYTKADQARKLIDSYADAHYYFAINLGQWGNRIGVLRALPKLGQMRDALSAAQTRNTKAGTPGKEMEGWGPVRVAGRVALVVPGFAGGSLKNAFLLSKESWTNNQVQGQEYLINTNYYAKVLSVCAKDDDCVALAAQNGVTGDLLAKAKEILEAGLKKSSNSFDPSREPETADERVGAEALLKELGSQ